MQGQLVWCFDMQVDVAGGDPVLFKESGGGLLPAAHGCYGLNAVNDIL